MLREREREICNQKPWIPSLVFSISIRVYSQRSAVSVSAYLCVWPNWKVDTLGFRGSRWPVSFVFFPLKAAAILISGSHSILANLLAAVLSPIALSGLVKRAALFSDGDVSSQALGIPEHLRFLCIYLLREMPSVFWIIRKLRTLITSSAWTTECKLSASNWFDVRLLRRKGLCKKGLSSSLD